MVGDAFIAFHGSWNRNPPTGYKVVRVPMNSGSPKVDEPIDFLCHGVAGAKFPNGFRPVDVVFDKCNRLLVTSDGTRGSGTGVVVVQYNREEDCSGCAPSPAPSPTGGCTVCSEDQGQDPFMTILIVLAVSAFTLIFLGSAWILYRKYAEGQVLSMERK